MQQSLQVARLDSFPSLHYNKVPNLAFCHLCTCAEKKASWGQTAKILHTCQKLGYFNRKDATEGFCHYEQLEYHVDAVQVTVMLPKSTHDVSEVL